MVICYCILHIRIMVLEYCSGDSLAFSFCPGVVVIYDVFESDAYKLSALHRIHQ